MKGPQYMSCQKKATGKFKNVVWSQTATNSFPAFLNSSVAIKLIIGHIIAIIIMEIASVITIGRSCAYSARTAHPFQRNGAPFRFKLSKAQQVD